MKIPANRPGIFRTALAIVAAFCLLPASAATIIWTNTSGGNWTNAANWSPNQVPTNTDTASITNSGTYTVTITSTTGASNVVVGSSSGTQTLALSSGSLNAANISTKTTNGTITLAGGTIANARISMTNGSSLVVSTGTFNGVTMGGTLDVGGSVSGASLTVTNGLVLNGTAQVGNLANGNYGYITFDGSQTLSGSGTVVFGEQTAPGYNALRLGDAATTLTIGSAMTVEGENGTLGYSSTWSGPQNVSVINQGLISANVSTGTMVVDAQPFDNNGTLTATLGTVALSGTFNFGGGTFGFGLSSTNSFGKIQISGSAALAGTVDATLLNGFVPTVGNSFPVLSYSSESGIFTGLNLPSGFTWQTNYGATTFSLTVSGTGPVIKPVLNRSGPFLLQFTGSTNAQYTVLATTNVGIAVSNWVTLGNASALSNNLFQFTDTNSTNFRTRFYILRSP